MKQCFTHLFKPVRPYRLSELVLIGLILLGLTACGKESSSAHKQMPVSQSEAGAHQAESSQGAGESEPQRGQKAGLISDAEADPHIFVMMETSLGNITLKLYPHLTPKTVDNFLHYMNKGTYNGVIFHHAQANYILQAGTYTADYKEVETDLPIQNEQFAGGISNSKGTLSMARPPERNVHLATSQFFINLKHNFRLNGSTRTPGYTVFGEVAEGFDIAEKIAQLPQGLHKDKGLPYAPNEPVVITKMYLLP